MRTNESTEVIETQEEATVSGYHVRYTRRRYSPEKVFTSVAALLEGLWHELGAPWEVEQPPRAEIEREIGRLIAAARLRGITPKKGRP